MWRFLSPEWIQALDRAARDHSESAGTTGAVVVEQHVVGGPDGAVVYHVQLGPDGWRAHGGPSADPDIVLRTDYDTAVALHRGTCTAQVALAAGRLRIGGRLDRVTDLAGALARIGTAWSAVPTELPDGVSPGGATTGEYAE